MKLKKKKIKYQIDRVLKNCQLCGQEWISYSNLILGEIGNVSTSTHSNRIKIVQHNKIVIYCSEHEVCGGAYFKN